MVQQRHRSAESIQRYQKGIVFLTDGLSEMPGLANDYGYGAWVPAGSDPKWKQSEAQTGTAGGLRDSSSKLHGGRPGT